jgi:hypothetical protein
MQNEATAPIILSPAEEFLRDTGHAWEREEDGTIYVSGLDLGKPNLEKYGKWPLKELPDLSSVVVEGEFRCSDNELVSLKGSPQVVTGNYYCYGNLLQSLEGMPEKVGGGFSCSGNPLRDLTGGPREVGGQYNCQSCPTLLTLKGAPEEVPSDFLCHEGVLESLEGGPKKVGGDMWVQKNKLRNIEHAPQEVGRFFQCHGNYIAHLEGAPEKFVKIFSDLGDFTSLAEIPDNIRYSPDTRGRQEEERLRAEAEQLEQSVQDATVLSRPIAIRRSALKLGR